MPARQRGWTPRMDMLEAAHFFVIRLELAGIRRDKISLSYSPDRHSLIVKGERSEDLIQAEDRCAAHLLEIEFGEFAREVFLPETPIDVANARTQMRSGMLYIVLPKTEERPITVTIEKTIIIRTI